MNYTAENFSLGTTTSSSFFPPQPIDLSGKLIIKAQLGDDIRRIPIHNEELTYDELLLMMQRVFRGRLNSTDDVTIKYKDEDGDLVTMFDSSDLAVAKSMSRIIRITLFVNGIPRPPEHTMVEEFRRELSHLRDRVLYLLDRLEIGDLGSSGGKIEEEKVPEKTKLDDSKSQKQQTVTERQPISTPVPTYPSVNTALFDPLQPKNDQQTVSSTSDLGGKPDEQGYPSQPKPATSQTQPSSSQPMFQQQSMTSSYSQKPSASYPQQNQQSYATSSSSVAQPQGYTQQSYSSMTTGTYPQNQPTSMGYQNYASNQPQTSQGYVPGGPPPTDGYTRAYSPQLQQQQQQQQQQPPQQQQPSQQQPPQQPQQQQQGTYQGYQTQKMNYPPQSTYDYSSTQYPYKYQ